ncbi:hypothetical protein ACIBCT_40075 [Streptosporangium sp. NPDC050855]|uniref:hypothetical protein n=1 Tax=Streptosporangium sp. NPDC050855 TaxID=3366194 RepID=UPI0037B9B0EA
MHDTASWPHVHDLCAAMSRPVSAGSPLPGGRAANTTPSSMGFERIYLGGGG